MLSNQHLSQSKASTRLHKCQITMGQLEAEARSNLNANGRPCTGKLFSQFWDETSIDFLKSYKARFWKKLSGQPSAKDVWLHQESEELAREALVDLFERVTKQVEERQMKLPGYNAFAFAWNYMFSPALIYVWKKKRLDSGALSFDPEEENSAINVKSSISLDEDEDKSQHPLQSVESHISFVDCIEGLDEVSALIVKMKFYDGLTQGAIGKKLGISQSRVSRVLGKILNELKQSGDFNSD